MVSKRVLRFLGRVPIRVTHLWIRNSVFVPSDCDTEDVGLPVGVRVRVGVWVRVSV